WPEERRCLDRRTVTAHVDVGGPALDLAPEEQVDGDVAVIDPADRPVGVHLHRHAAGALESYGRTACAHGHGMYRDRLPLSPRGERQSMSSNPLIRRGCPTSNELSPSRSSSSCPPLPSAFKVRSKWHPSTRSRSSPFP